MAEQPPFMVDVPASDVAGLQRNVLEFARRLKPLTDFIFENETDLRSILDALDVEILTNVSVSSNGTTIPHGMGSAPSTALAILKASPSNGGVVYQTASPDDTNVYLAVTPFETWQTFRGRNLAGLISVPGLLVGDVVTFVLGIGPGLGITGIASSAFESVVTVANELQQTAALDQSGVNYIVQVRRPRAVSCDVVMFP